MNKEIKEDAPTNSTGTAIAGTTPNNSVPNILMRLKRRQTKNMDNKQNG